MSRLVGFVAAALTVLGLWALDVQFAPSAVIGFIAACTSAGATILGFLVSAGALLYAVTNTRVARNLQRTGHFADLVRDLFVDASAFLVVVIAGLASTLFFGAPPIEDSVQMSRLLSTIIFFNVVAYAWLIPVGWKMWLLLVAIRPDDPDRLD